MPSRKVSVSIVVDEHEAAQIRHKLEYLVEQGSLLAGLEILTDDASPETEEAEVTIIRPDSDVTSLDVSTLDGDDDKDV
ncbi:MAG: hypothetical protein AAF720_00830 [Pseudomonadota bacterium]